VSALVSVLNLGFAANPLIGGGMEICLSSILQNLEGSWDFSPIFCKKPTTTPKK